MSIDKSIALIEKSISLYEIKNSAISAAAIGWHLDHSLKVINSVCNAIKTSQPKDYKPTFSLIKSYVFITGKIPRGKAKAPKNVVSTTEILKENLIAQLIAAKSNLIEIKKLPAKSHFPHPYFGMLSLKKGLLFLAIHTNHHLKIVDEIVKNK